MKLPLISLLTVLAVAAVANEVTPPSKLKLLANSGDIEGVKELLSNGANINDTKGAFGGSALMWAKDEKMTEFLLSNGADPKILNSQNMSALMEAARNGDIKQAKLLVEAGLKINDKDNLGKSSVHYAIGNLNPEFTRFLLESGGYVDVQDSKGVTPLMMSMRYAEVGQVRVLLDFGANTNLRNSEGKKAIDLLKNTNPSVEPEQVQKVENLLTKHNQSE